MLKYNCPLTVVYKALKTKAFFRVYQKQYRTADYLYANLYKVYTPWGGIQKNTKKKDK
jgi:hypothetical protein